GATKRAATRRSLPYRSTRCSPATPTSMTSPRSARTGCSVSATSSSTTRTWKTASGSSSTAGATRPRRVRSWSTRWIATRPATTSRSSDFRHRPLRTKRSPAFLRRPGFLHLPPHLPVVTGGEDHRTRILAADRQHVGVGHRVDIVLGRHVYLQRLGGIEHVAHLYAERQLLVEGKRAPGQAEVDALDPWRTDIA